MTVLHFVRGEAQIGAVLLRRGPGDPGEYGRLIAHFVTPERMPTLAAASAAGIFAAGDGDPEQSFTFGLTRVLDGIDVMVTRGGG
jgi:hypothetical protein